MAGPSVNPTRAVVIVIVVGALLALAIPFFQQSPDFLSLNPVEQYIIWNAGIALLFTGFFGVLIASALKKKKHYTLGDLFINGLAAFAVFSFVIDMVEPPYALNAMGEFIIPAGATLEGTSVDFMTAWLWQTSFNIQGPALFWMTYLVTPILALIAFTVILGPKRLLRVYGGSA